MAHLLGQVWMVLHTIYSTVVQSTVRTPHSVCQSSISLTHLLQVAAEALQALAAEDVSCRQEISQTRSLLPLVDMLANGSLLFLLEQSVQCFAILTYRSGYPPNLATCRFEWLAPLRIGDCGSPLLCFCN